MATIEELRHEQEKERHAEAVRQEQYAEQQRLIQQDIAVEYLERLGLECHRSSIDVTVEAEGYTVWMTERVLGGEFPRTDTHLYLKKGRSVTVHRATSYYDFRDGLLSAMAEADELDRLNNRPHVEKLLTDIRAGRWEDNYALTDEEFAPWADELTAEWDAWLAEHKRRQDELNKPQPTIDALAKSLAALEQRTAETGLMGRMMRRIEGLEERSNYGRVIIDHEKRLKALEAAQKPADTPNHDGMVMVSQMLLEDLIGDTQHLMSNAAGMAEAISDKTVYENGRLCELIGLSIAGLEVALHKPAPIALQTGKGTRISYTPDASEAQPAPAMSDEDVEVACDVLEEMGMVRLNPDPVTYDRETIAQVINFLTDIVERGHEWEARMASNVVVALTGDRPHTQSAGPFPVKSDEAQS